MSESQTRPSILTGAELVLPDRVEQATLVVRDGRIDEIVVGPRGVGDDEVRVDVAGRLIVPGFVDVHIHGVDGVDVLDGAGAVATVARRLPRYGVTAFCPTSVACEPTTLDRFLSDVAQWRRAQEAGARVLGAHLESNFLNPEWAGAQPVPCLRDVSGERSAAGAGSAGVPFSGRDVIAVIERHRADIAVVTMAPEVPGGAELVRALVALGIRVSVGHSGATFDQATAAFAAGARHATHLFNRMSGLSAREPGVAGAALADDRVAVEVICDGRHVHPSVVRVVVAAKGVDRVMAITDATAGAGLPRGSTAHLGGRTITVEDVARLEDGTWAGSVLTMDRAFAMLVTVCGLGMVDAARLCSTTPAAALGAVGLGVIAPGAVADFVVLDRNLNVVETWIAGRRT
jgi:N-acetylglucosamine-6-phosphate deacetylase